MARSYGTFPGKPVPAVSDAKSTDEQTLLLVPQESSQKTQEEMQPSILDRWISGNYWANRLLNWGADFFSSQYSPPANNKNTPDSSSQSSSTEMNRSNWGLHI